MRTNTLLIAAASALAAAVTSSQAQSTVYSQNIVGYVNLGVTANQYALYSPALDVDGTGTNGTISTVLGTNVDQNTVVLVWNGAGYDNLVYESTAGRGSGLGWVLGGSGPDASYKLNVGQGFFIDDPGPNVTNITETGVVMQGTVVNPYVSTAGNYALLGSEIPIAGDLTTNLNYIPSQNDVVLEWNGNGFNNFVYESTAGRGSGLGWVLGGVGPQNPTLNVGQGFFLNPAANNTWTEVFTNN